MTASAIERHVTTRVGAIALSDEGTGTPVLLWPSLFSDRRLYTQVCRLLRGDWRTVRIDGPGFGRSDPPRGEVQPETYADVVVELLDALGIGKAIVAGCSWGGQIAAHVGVKAADRVSGVLIMNAPLAPSLGGHAFEVFGTRWFGASPFWGKGVARSMIAPAAWQTHPERIREFVSAFPSFDRRAAATTVRTVLTRSPGLEGVLPKLAVPTTILMGEEDRLYPVDRLRGLAARLAPGATLEIVPSCGHLAPLEAPEAVVAALQRLAVDAHRRGAELHQDAGLT